MKKTHAEWAVFTINYRVPSIVENLDSYAGWIFADWTEERDRLIGAMRKAIDQCDNQGPHTGASFKQIADGLLKELS